MNGKVEDKLKAVTQATRDLDKAHAQLGRIAIRNARRSLWARIQALKEECDAQYVLPPKPKPASHNTLTGMAKRMTAIGFNSHFPPYAIQWPIDSTDSDRLSPEFRGGAAITKVSHEVFAIWVYKLTTIVSNSCAHYGVPPCSLDATQMAALNFDGSGRLGLRGITQPQFLRQLAKWILFQQGELKLRRKAKSVKVRGSGIHNTTKRVRPKPGETTKDGTIEVNLLMIEIAKLNGLITQERIDRDVMVTTEEAT